MTTLSPLPEFVTRAIQVLEHIRERPAMYLGVVSVDAVQLFLSGFDTALYAFDLPRSEARRQATNDCGWDFTARAGVDLMRERGYTEAQIVDELLLIEIGALRLLADQATISRPAP